MACEHFTRPRLAGLLILLVALFAVGSSFLAPHWATVGRTHVGLLGTCQGKMDKGTRAVQSDRCQWFMDDDFEWERHLKEWQYACQVLVTLSLLFVLVALPDACATLCCNCNDCVAKMAGVLLFVAGCFMALAVIVFGACFYGDPVLGKGYLDWAFYIGMIGSICSFVASGLFLCTPEKYEAMYV